VRNQEQDLRKPRKKESAGRLRRGRVLPIHPPLPFHICSLTSSALSWEKTECLSRGGGVGSRESQEAWLWGWMAARSTASFPPDPHAVRSRACSPLGTNKQEIDTNLALAPSGGSPSRSLTAFLLTQDLLSPTPDSQNKGFQKQEVTISKSRTNSS
jgi:hypothetical protein